jgi:hypothetical protein
MEAAMSLNQSANRSWHDVLHMVLPLPGLMLIAALATVDGASAESETAPIPQPRPVMSDDAESLPATAGTPVPSDRLPEVADETGGAGHVQPSVPLPPIRPLLVVAASDEAGTATSGVPVPRERPAGRPESAPPPVPAAMPDREPAPTPAPKPAGPAAAAAPVPEPKPGGGAEPAAQSGGAPSAEPDTAAPRPAADVTPVAEPNGATVTGPPAPETGPESDGEPVPLPEPPPAVTAEPAEDAVLEGDSEDSSAAEAPPEPLGPPQFAVGVESAACPVIEEGGVSGRPLAPVVGPAECVVPALYAISSLGTERAVILSPEISVNCDMAGRLDRFVEEVVEPAALDILGSNLEEIGIAGSFVCRARNGVAGAPPSEHARANAVDISVFILADGRAITVSQGWTEEGDVGRFLHEVHAKACGPFTTVIGPDGDEYHRDHFHLDLKARGADGQTTFCQ